MSINEWIERIINGAGGFNAKEEHENMTFKDRDKAIAEFVIRSLGNNKSVGSEHVIKEIVQKRKQK